MAAFAAPCTVDTTATDSTYGQCINGHPGSEGRNAFNAPNYTNFDFSLTKTSHLTKTVSMELRSDFFNVFNHRTSATRCCRDLALTSSATATQWETAWWRRRPHRQRTAVHADHCDAGCGQRQPILGGGGPRSAQLAVHFTF